MNEWLRCMQNGSKEYIGDPNEVSQLPYGIIRIAAIVDLGQHLATSKSLRSSTIYAEITNWGFSQFGRDEAEYHSGIGKYTNYLGHLESNDTQTIQHEYICSKVSTELHFCAVS